jgi:hypothetical protein
MASQKGENAAIIKRHYDDLLNVITDKRVAL